MRHGSVTRCTLGVCVLALLGVATAAAAPPVVPEKLSYQGVLLDDEGLPRTGSVDLTLRIYDALFGGTLLYVQTLNTVPLTDGVFSVVIGPNGASSDVPDDPLTTSLAEALAGDLSGTGPSRFLEVTVGAEGALTRTQVLTAPYALRAESAAQADAAQTATSVTTVGGLPADVLLQIFENTNLDNSGPPNNDPSEGLADPDGDGIQNFVDFDNDNDGISDSGEVSQGSNINLVTPNLRRIRPDEALAVLTTTVVVEGDNLDPGMSVEFGSQTPVAMNLELDSPNATTGTDLFEVAIGPQPVGNVQTRVTLPNGETDAISSFDFRDSLDHDVAFEVTGVGLQASFDAAFDALVLVGGGVGFPSQRGHHVLLPLEYPVNFPTASSAFPGQISVSFDPAGRIAGLRCRDLGNGDCDVEIAVDSDGDYDLKDETGVLVESLTNGTPPTILSPSLRFDPAGRPLAGYFALHTTYDAVVAHDRDGDGQFTGPSELVVVDTGVGTRGDLGRVAADAGGRAAFVYFDNTLKHVRLAWDRNDDGDFADTVGGNPELFSVASLDPGIASCVAAAFAPDGDLAVLYGTGTDVVFARDGNADGDFADAGESGVLESGTAPHCDLTSEGGVLAAVYRIDGGSTLRARIDRNDDGDFDDANETFDRPTSAPANTKVGVAKSDSGQILLMAGEDVYGVPNP